MKQTMTILTVLLMTISCQSNSQKEVDSSLKFDIDTYQSQTLQYENQELKVRAFENIIYVENPVDSGYQIMNIYIPEAYFNNESINGYTAETAPIFYPNQIGGYMPAKPGTFMPSQREHMMAPPNGKMPDDRKPKDGHGKERGNRPHMNFPKRANTIAYMISKGYVVATAGARGRTLQKKDGTYTGKAPAGLVDLKAGVKYLRFNDANMPGDANKIISNGTSAGGAMSTLLGATGNSVDYEPYFIELGAADASDDIFAVSAYCPITNLDNADAAYEWQFNGVNEYAGRSFGSEPGKQQLTSEQIAISAQLKELFPTYVNSLELKDEASKIYTLDKQGNGSFKELVKSYILASAQKQLDAGNDLSAQSSWLKIENGKAVAMEWKVYVRYMQRQKTPPAFDGLDLSSPENIEFGDASKDGKHFTTFSMDNTKNESATMADPLIIKMMNPMYYLGQKEVTNSKYWRIRHGSQDKDTGLAISVILATKLKNLGIDTDLLLAWEKPHSGDYDLEELSIWIDSICK